MRRAFVFVALLALGRSAHADRDQQAEQIIKSRCGDCHVVGHGATAKELPHAFVDLTLATKRHPDTWITQWLKSPHSIKSDSRCYTSGLDNAQIEALVAFLHTRAEVTHAHAIPKMQIAPPRPPEPPPKPRGLVRGQ